ncbi:MAG: hypothetical protein AAFY47_02790, partial [Pseudomonadota bacterium]
MNFDRPGAARLIFCSAAALGMTACASTPEPVIGQAVTQPRADLGQAGYTFQRSTTYLLRSSDRISINVFREPDFSVESVQVGVEGN